MTTFILLCTVIAIVALFINGVTRSLGEIVTDSTTTSEQPRKEAVQDMARVVNLERAVKLKANEDESKFETQDAA